MDNITMKINADNLIMMALREDVTSEDITTNSVMPEYQLGTVDLICKQDGVISGLNVFKRVFELLDSDTKVELFFKDGDSVKNKDLIVRFNGIEQGNPVISNVLTINIIYFTHKHLS